VVTRRRIEPRRRADRVSDRRPRGRRRRSRDRRRLLGVGAAIGCVVALALGLTITYVATADDSVPTRLGYSAVSPTAARLTWRATGADYYLVTVGTDRSLTDSRTTKVEGSKSSVTISDLKSSSPGSDRYFRVDAVDGDKKASSRTARFLLAPDEIGKTDKPKVSADGVRLAWEPVANARQYDVVIATDKDLTQTVTRARTATPDPLFVIRGLEADHPYWAQIRAVNDDLVGEWSAPVAFSTRAPSVTFRLATWNVCSEKCSGYASRARVMADFLNDSEVDMFALQESGGVRVGRTTNAIFSGGKRGFKRATGGAKARYIFYRPALFKQLGGGYFAVGHGRHATWARFQAIDSGRAFYVVDVHLENGHGNDRKRAAETRTLLARMASINTQGDPIIYAGDFNSGKHRSSDSPGALMRGAGLSDTVDLTKDTVNEGINTGHTFSTRVLRSGAHVDHIFASHQFQVLQWKQLVRISNGSYTRPVVSDHNAVSAKVALDSVETDIGESTKVTRMPGPGPTSLQ